MRRNLRMMWMEGPAGVGKSALAQSCAEEVGAKLAAAFFFSRTNGWDDSRRLFPSIAYQLTRKYPEYHKKLDEKISYDPTLVHSAAIEVQFRELIVLPLQELQKEGENIEEGVIFIDGLDECTGENAQCSIVNAISASVRKQTTPFIWGFFSRPEPRIVTHFTSPHIRDSCWKLALPVSHEADEDVKIYLEAEFGRIRAQYAIPSTTSWPSENDKQVLVRRSAGLFIYPTSVVWFVGGDGPKGPVERLRSVLRLPGESVSEPWSYLDGFYTLLMKGIPEDMLPNTLKILSLTCIRGGFGRYHFQIATEILGLSLPNYCAALSKLHSVVSLTHTEDGARVELKFHHTSFTEFLVNPERSKEFCVSTPKICALLLADVIECFNRGPSNRTYPIFYLGHAI